MGKTAGIVGGSASLSLLMEHLPIGVLLLARDLDILHCNTACSAFGAQPGGEFLGLVHPDDAGRLAFECMRFILSGSQSSTSAEARFRLVSGAERWQVVTIGPAEGLAEEAVLLVTVTDVDTFRRPDLERRMWEERWNAALVSSTLGVWDHDFKSGTMYYSDTWKQIRGMRPDEEVDAETNDWIVSVHPDDRAHVLEWIRKQNEGEVSSAAFEYRERRKDGSWIWIECRGSSIEWDADGMPTRIVGTDLDITERKATEEMLAKTQRRLKLALDVIEIGVFEADITDGTLELDDRLLAILDIKGEPNLQPADDWEHVIHPEDRGKASGRIAVSVEQRAPFSNEFRILRKDGSIRHIRARAAPFADASGHVKYIGANWDVTADVVMREELQRANELAEERNRQLQGAKEKIEHNALHDFLTDLPNRRFLDEKIGARNQPQWGLAVLHIDLDRFKQINDTLGHEAGDFMLRHAARILSGNLPLGGFVARIGGDEFVILADFGGDCETLELLADRIIRQMCEPVSFEGMKCRIGASIGIACNSNPGVDARQLLLNADIALYRAKSRGRNRHEFFSVDIQNQVIHNKRVSDEILSALERDEFVPHYQLQFSAQTLDVAGVETLARWQHPDAGLLGPGAFLTLAEDLDVLAKIDSVIFEKALADFAVWRSLGLTIPKISVNVSTRRLYDVGLPAQLARLPITPGTVSFELLESIFLDECDTTVLQNLRAFRAMGIGIEIDDFGTGHASIVGLLKIGPGTLKIDRELVMPITQSLDQRRLVGSIIEMARSLNVKVVAEGVETTEHVRILQELGCDTLQGFALARPMPRDQIEGFVRAGKWRR